MKEGDGIALFRFERVRTGPIAVPVPRPIYTPKRKAWQNYMTVKNILIRLCDIKLNLKNEEVKLLILIICKVILNQLVIKYFRVSFF